MGARTASRSARMGPPAALPGVRSSGVAIPRRSHATKPSTRPRTRSSAPSSRASPGGGVSGRDRGLIPAPWRLQRKRVEYGRKKSPMPPPALHSRKTRGSPPGRDVGAASSSVSRSLRESLCPCLRHGRFPVGERVAKVNGKSSCSWAGPGARRRHRALGQASGLRRGSLDLPSPSRRLRLGKSGWVSASFGPTTGRLSRSYAGGSRRATERSRQRSSPPSSARPRTTS